MDMSSSVDPHPVTSIRGLPLQRERPYIVAIDGPAGSGKSSICFHVCERIGWTYVNTGALYRAVGWVATRDGVDLADEHAVAGVVEALNADLKWEPARRTLFYRGRDLTQDLLSEAAGTGASKVAKLPLVRDRLLPLQKQLALGAPRGALVDGRDIGTVVFPDADLKIFLTASLEERAKRRLAQLGESMETGRLQDVMRDIGGRDERDAAREVAPLKQAGDAVLVDTSALSLDDTVATIVRLIEAKGLLR